MKAGTYGYPADEVGKVGYYDRNGNCLFVITCKRNSTEYYYLYEAQKDASLKRIDKSKDPHSLVLRHHVEEAMNGKKPSSQEKQVKTGMKPAARRKGTKASA